MENEYRITDDNLSFNFIGLLDELCPQTGVTTIENRVETDLDSDPEFVAEYLKAQFIEFIIEGMEKNKINKTELAKRLNKSRQYISNVINEKANFTLESMAAISCALKMSIKIILYDITSEREIESYSITNRLEIKNLNNMIIFNDHINQQYSKYPNGSFVDVNYNSLQPNHIEPLAS